MKIYVWGTGVRLKCFLIESNLKVDNIEAFIDNDISKNELYGKKIYRPKQMLDVDYDLIIVASNYSIEISNQCDEIGLDKNKIFFPYNHYLLNDINTGYDLAESIFENDFLTKIKEMYFIINHAGITDNLFLHKSNLKNDFYYQNDHVKISSFELVVKEINNRNVPGEVAEVGVFKGEFAQYINYAFPDKKCYLIDMFEESDEQEFKNANVEKVMEKMTYPENVIIKKGYFSDSLEEIEEQFAFVSLDVDLEGSMYECLKYFYPRLSSGGYIFVHDYSSNIFSYVRKAVEKYENENGIILPKIPLADKSGTLVITK